MGEAEMRKFGITKKAKEEEKKASTAKAAAKNQVKQSQNSINSNLSLALRNISTNSRPAVDN